MTDKERIARAARHHSSAADVRAPELAAAAAAEGRARTGTRRLTAVATGPQRGSGSAGWAAHPHVARLLAGPGWTRLRVACDLLAVVAGCLVGMIAVSSPDGELLLLLFPPLALLLLHSRGCYVPGRHDHVLDDVAPGFGAVSISAMTIVTLQLLLTPGDGQAVGSMMAWTWSASLAGVTLAGIALPTLQRSARRRGLAGSRTLIVGTDDSALDIALRLQRHPEYGLELAGFPSAATAAAPGDVAPMHGGLEDLVRVTAEQDVRNIILAYPETTYEELLAFVARCDSLGVQTMIVPRLASAVNHQTRFEYLGTVPLLNLRAINPESTAFAVKHAIDRVVASTLLVMLSPLLLAIAIAVRCSSPGPILFRQLRAGRDGRVFNLLKFRTMRIDDDRTSELFEVDPGMAPGGVEGFDRRTRVGRLLRSSSLDELPQLINVVRGEMSLVGPRPERPEFAELFQRDIERYQDRHRVRSGITGWAQVHGLRGQTPLIDRVEFDNFYIEHWSLSLDLKIILLTIPALLRGS